MKDKVKRIRDSDFVDDVVKTLQSATALVELGWKQCDGTPTSIMAREIFPHLRCLRVLQLAGPVLDKMW